MVRLHRTYPLWLHLLHMIYHGGMSAFQIGGFVSSLLPSTHNLSTAEGVGPGWRFRYVTTWILSVLVLYMMAAFVFDILLVLRGVNDSIIKQLRIHLDRFFCLMFSTSVGIGFFFHLLFFSSCVKNHHCPKYTDSLWFIHLMPFWYGLVEHRLVPHSTRRDIKTTPVLVFVFCLMYFINYWLFVAQTHGAHPYGNPWPAWQWCVYFCFPLTMVVLRLLSIVRDRLFYKRQWRSLCVHPQHDFRVNPWTGWHPDYTHLDLCESQPFNWKAIGAMVAILSIGIFVWNILYLITSSSI
jgi:hypothetical protein